MTELFEEQKDLGDKDFLDKSIDEAAVIEDVAKKGAEELYTIVMKKVMANALMKQNEAFKLEILKLKTLLEEKDERIAQLEKMNEKLRKQKR